MFVPYIWMWDDIGPTQHYQEPIDLVFIRPENEEQNYDTTNSGAW